MSPNVQPLFRYEDEWCHAIPESQRQSMSATPLSQSSSKLPADAGLGSTLRPHGLQVAQVA